MRRALRQIFGFWFVAAIALVVWVQRVDAGVIFGAVAYGLPIGFVFWCFYRLFRYAFFGGRNVTQSRTIDV